MDRIKRRQDFVAAARAAYSATPGIVVQLRRRGDDAPARVGFTATKKIGNAVIRNRTKRRLREIARLTLSEAAWSGFDYVLIGRAATAEREYADLVKDLKTALKHLHRRPSEAGEPRKP